MGKDVDVLRAPPWTKGVPPYTAERVCGQSAQLVPLRRQAFQLAERPRMRYWPAQSIVAGGRFLQVCESAQIGDRTAQPAVAEVRPLRAREAAQFGNRFWHSQTSSTVDPQWDKKLANS